MTSRPIRKTLLAATLAAAITQPASAQNMLEEVIVVAQKREESLQDTAIAITALSSDALDSLNITNSSDFEAIVPSLSVRDEPRRLFIRGIGTVTNSLGTDPGVAVYTDQVYQSTFGALGRTSSLTMERIEVLRGPQGTLFGRSATGGAVNIISKRPTEEFEHHARVKAGDYGLFNWGASSSGPVTDSLGYRVHVYGDERDGYLDNKGGNDVWDQDHDGWGAQLSWDATDTLNVWLKYESNETRDRRAGIFPGGYLITPYNTTDRSLDSAFLNEGYQWDRENPAIKDPYEVDMGDAPKDKTDNNHIYTTHVTWDLPVVTLKYIGNYSESDYSVDGVDFGYTSRPDIRLTQTAIDETESHAHELQFLSAGEGPLQWVGGLYYYHQEKEQPYGIRNLEASYMANVSGYPEDPTTRPNPDLWGYFQTADLDSDSYAAYADFNYTFDETWKLTAGLRYSYDEKEGDETQFTALDPIALGIPPTSDDCCGILFINPELEQQNLDDDWDNVSGRVVLDYMYSDEHMVYGSISSGYKSGGFRLGTISENPYFDEETVLAYEIGYKGTFDGTLQVNAAAYFYDYEDMQVLVGRVIDAELGLTVPEMVNADEAEVKGAEVEAIWLATENLTLMANYSYIDGEYTDFCCYFDERAEDANLGTPEEQDLSGNPLTQAPENKIFLNASYSLSTSSWGEFVPSVSYSWVDERQFDVFDTESTLADDYYRLDAVVTWFSPSQNIRVIASGRNLTEEETWTSLERIGTDGAVTGQINEPRTWAIEVQYDF